MLATLSGGGRTGRCGGRVVVVRIHGAVARRGLSVPARILRLLIAVVASGTRAHTAAIGWSLSVVRHNLVTILHIMFVHLRCQRLTFILLECRKANLVLACDLASLPVRLCLDSIETHLFRIRIVWGRATCFSVRTTRAPSDAAPTEAVEATGKEEQNPGCKSEPKGHAYLGLPAVHCVDAAPGEEEEDEIEDESDEGDRGGEAGYAGAAVRHRHLADVCEQAKDGRHAGEEEGDDVEYEGVCDPLYEYLGDFDRKAVPQQTVDI